MAKSKVIDRDKGLNRILKLPKDLSKPYVEVGILSDENEDLKTYASANEFGTDTIPERSFIRTTMDESHSKILQVRDKAIRSAVLRGASPEDALSVIGAFVETLIKQKITDVSEPPNAPSTIAKKGSANPLVDTGRMRSAVSHRVRNTPRPKAGGGS